MPATIIKADFFDPHKIAASGQAFRIHSIDSTHTEVTAFGRYLQIADLSDGSFAFSCSEKDLCDIWTPFFDLSTDYLAVYNSIDPADSYLRASAEFGYGIRILRQDIFEAVISYIISQRRSIASITTCVDRLCELCGTVVEMPKLDPAYFVKPIKEKYYAFPSVEQMSSLSLEDLAGIGAGYRAPYILSAVRDFSSGKLCPDSMCAASDEKLFEILTSMYGVGVKVANCVMLFAFHRCGRFPVDVWVQRIQDRYYNGSFDCSRYPETAGIMQQFMFYYERVDKEH